MHERPLAPLNIKDETPEVEYLRAKNASEPTQIQLRKCQIEGNFRTWLDRLPEEKIAESKPESATASETNDLYSFYRELCALRHEFRKSFHRNHDSTTRFADTLEDFSGLMQQINRRLDQHDSARNLAEQQSQRQLFLPLVDIYERFLRLQEHLEQTRPKKTFWQRQRHIAELEEQQNKLSKGFEILEKHFLALLEKAGVRRRVCRGEKFDPTTMTAIEVVNRPEIAADEVVRELSAGYSFHDQTLKLAEVIVNRGDAGFACISRHKGTKF
ncbi:MAG: nucleotide exchange factor GrpE [Pseudomonadota bacterium]|nr:nucleotide exchange factor GrpE [Pseudomonadota bacterium]